MKKKVQRKAEAALAKKTCLSALSAFNTLNFTGCTPYTSRSWVRKEMRLGMPVMGCALVVSALLLMLGWFGGVR